MNINENYKFRGIFGIPVTPFNTDDSLDKKSLEKIIHFTIENGCNGIVMPVMASEYQTLTDLERKTIIEKTVQITNTRIPVSNSSAPAERGPLSQVTSVQGIMTRDAQDLALATEVMIRPDPRDPLCPPIPWRGSPLDDPISVAVT